MNTTLHLRELGKLHQAMIAWKNPRLRARLIYTWSHPSHPHSFRYIENSLMWDRLLSLRSFQEVDLAAEDYGHTLRTIAKDLPSVFWDLWNESRNLSSAATVL